MKYEGRKIGDFSWRIIRLSTDPRISNDYPQKYLEDRSLIPKTTPPTPPKNIDFSRYRSALIIDVGYDISIGADRAQWHYFYIRGEGRSNTTTSESEAVVSYRQILPSTD